MSPSSSSHPRVHPAASQEILRLQHKHALFFMAVLPVAACYFCIISSYVMNFEHVANLTQKCHVEKAAKVAAAGGQAADADVKYELNHMPSVSWSIGVYQPQRLIWIIVLIIHAFPRIAVGPIYLHLFQSTSSPLRNTLWYNLLCHAVCWLQHLEWSSLILVSLIDIDEYFHGHAVMFVAWVAAFGFGMVGQTVLMHLSGWRFTNVMTRRVYIYRAIAGIIGFLICLITPHIYIIYMENCSAAAYAAFSIGEYLMVGWMIVYYLPTYYELGNVHVTMSVHFDGEEFRSKTDDEGEEMDKLQQTMLNDDPNNNTVVVGM